MRKNILILTAFILLIVIVTFPLLFKINAHLSAFFSTDETYAALWDSWRIKYSFRNNISFTHTPLIAYPSGWDLYNSGYWPYLGMGLFYFLSILTTPVITYNSQVLINFFLSGTLTYILVLYLTRNRLSAFFSGIIFTFCPYQFMRAWQHLGLTYNQWIPLCLFTAILLKENSQRKHSVLFLTSLLLLLSFDFSIMYLGTIALLSFFIYVIFYNWRIFFFEPIQFLKASFKYLKRVIIIVIIAIVILSPQFYPIVKNMFRLSSITSASAFNPYHRPFEDLFAQSVKPLSYFLPAIVHPVFGKFTESFIGSSLYGDSLTEHTLYLGWIPLTLAFIALKKWKKNRKEVKLGTVPCGDSPYYKENFYIGFFIFLAIVAWFFSQPPWWKFGPLKIFMPSFFMYKILPMYRAYCRFGIVVMLAVAVLAGFGLKFILDKFKTQKVKIAITTLFCGLVLFEFWNWPPYKVIDVSKVPAVYYWLKEQAGDFAIAEYPLDADSPNEMYKFYQTKHEKKIINGTIPGSYANKVAQTITKLSSPNTAGILKWMGVKYALVHRDGYLQTELIEDREELDKIPQNKGLKFIRSFPPQECPQKDIMCVQKTGPIDVHEVIARPILSGTVQNTP